MFFIYRMYGSNRTDKTRSRRVVYAYYLRDFYQCFRQLTRKQLYMLQHFVSDVCPATLRGRRRIAGNYDWESRFVSAG
jgi:hypothetical protein